MATAASTLRWPDYIILAAFLLISLAIGIYHSVTGGRQKTTQEFIMANRHLGVLPTAISLFVSFQSAIVVLGNTAEMYVYGVQYLVWVPIAFAIATLTAERLIVPWIYPLKLVSINDYLELRYGSRAVRILGALISIIGGILYMGVAMYAPSAALESATGLPTEISIPLMAVATITYTALGGMRAVIWTDVFQCGAMIGGMLTIMIKGIVDVGGFRTVLEICGREGRLDAVNWSPDPTVRHTVWGFLIGYTFNWIQQFGLSQPSVQRYSATESLTKARLTMLLNIPATALLIIVGCTIGLTTFAYYSKTECDPLRHGDITTPNQLLSLFVVTIFANSPGFAGLFLATLYGGALSTVSSSLSGVAANCWDDILKLKLSAMSEQRKVFVNRFLVIIFGAIAAGVAFTAAVVPGPITQIAITFYCVYGPMLGLFLMGGISRRITWKGAIVGGIGGLCVNTWLSVGAFWLGVKPPRLPPTSTDGCPGLSNITLSATNTTNALLDQVTLTSTYSGTASSLTSLLDETLSITELTGLRRFYCISYLWYSLLGALTTVVIGLITSLIFRDRKAENEVEERLLIPFRQLLSWSGESKDGLTKDELKDTAPSLI